MEAVRQNQQDPMTQLVTRADLESFAQRVQRPQVDPSRITNDEDRQIAAILEKLEKDPVAGFKEHTQFMVKGVAEAVIAANRQQFEVIRETQELPAFREAIIKRIAANKDGTELNDEAKSYLRTFLSTDYNMQGLRAIASSASTLDALRNTAENVHNKTRGVKPASSGGTGGGAAQNKGGGGLTDEQEADAQEMFKQMSGVKGYTIEKAREAVAGVGSDPGFFDPSNIVALQTGR